MATDLTVFVPTCGPRPSLGRCLAALEAQTLQTPVEVIRDVAPMSAAFGQMVKRCKTSFFVQCDDDMLLRADALERVWRDIVVRPPAVAIVAHPLWDTHLEMIILGVKAYDTAAIAAVGGWRDVQGCEADQNARLEAAGGVVVMQPLELGYVVGDHDPMYTPEMAFERYFDLTLKQRRFDRARWVNSLPALFERRLESWANPVDLAALEGCRAALEADLDATNREKDFLSRPWRAAYLAIAARCGLPVDP